MSDFLILYKDHLYYTDTDSFAIDIPLDPKFIGDGLGQFKLEHYLDEAVFLAPKVYGGIENGSVGKNEFIKIKGSKKSIKFNELKSLLVKDSSLEINQDKWYRNVSNGNIKVKSEIYTLMATTNKRINIYKENKFVDTKPIVVDPDSPK
jgi:hypothetical protein